MDADRPTSSPGGRPESLGALLRDARLSKGLELSDIAARTHVRQVYLSALEEGRYQVLPEDVFARNFVKLYARAVGLPAERALELYDAERRRARAGHDSTGTAASRPAAPPSGRPERQPEARASGAPEAPAKPERTGASDEPSDAAGGVAVYPTPPADSSTTAVTDPARAAAPEATPETTPETTVPPRTGSGNAAPTGSPAANDQAGPRTGARREVENEVWSEPPRVRRTTLLSSSPPAKPARRAPRVGAWLPTLLLIVVVGGLAVWAFNALLFGPRAPVAEPVTDPAAAPPAASTSTPATTPAASGEGAATESATPLAGAERLAYLSLTTDPPGAQVSIDGYPLPDTTPIENYPFSPGADRTLRITLEGYEPYQAVIDLSRDVSLTVPLTPSSADAPVEAGTSALAEASPSAAVEGPVTVRIEEESWLEAYASTQRGVGERLVYTTVQPGQTFTFPLPVYLHVGNGAGVHVWINGQDRGRLGSSGEVVSRAFTQ